MNKITDYDIIRSATVFGLAVEVQKNIVQGWQPFGNILLIPGDGHKDNLYHQAVVKYENPLV